MTSLVLLNGALFDTLEKLQLQIKSNYLESNTIRYYFDNIIVVNNPNIKYNLSLQGSSGQIFFSRNQETMTLPFKYYLFLKGVFSSMIDQLNLS